MDIDLTVSRLDRQNILNNDLAIAEIQKQTRIQGIYYTSKISCVLQNAWLPHTLK